MVEYYFLIKCSTHCDEANQEVTNRGLIKLLVLRIAKHLGDPVFETGKYLNFTPITNGSSYGFLLATMSKECFKAYLPEQSSIVRKHEDIIVATKAWQDTE